MVGKVFFADAVAVEFEIFIGEIGNGEIDVRIGRSIVFVEVKRGVFGKGICVHTMKDVAHVEFAVDGLGKSGK